MAKNSREARPRPFTQIAALSDATQGIAVEIGQELGLPVPAREVMARVHDKAAMRHRLREAGIDTTPCIVARGRDELLRAIAVIGYPVVVKPTTGGGSTGVSVVRGPAEVDRAWNWSGGPGGTTLLVERFHEGPEYSIEAISQEGRHRVVAITRKFTEPVHRLELGHVLPAVLPGDQARVLCHHAQAVLSALGVENGVTHTEIVLTEAGPRTIETHLRPGGDRIPDLLREATGADLVDLLARLTLGQDVLADLPDTDGLPWQDGSRSDRFAAIWFASPTSPGHLKAVHGIERAAAAPQVVDVEQLVQAGSTVEGARSSATRGVLVKAVADREQVAADAAAEAASLVHFDVTVEP